VILTGAPAVKTHKLLESYSSPAFMDDIIFVTFSYFTLILVGYTLLAGRTHNLINTHITRLLFGLIDVNSIKTFYIRLW